MRNGERAPRGERIVNRENVSLAWGFCYSRARQSPGDLFTRQVHKKQTAKRFKWPLWTALKEAAS